MTQTYTILASGYARAEQPGIYAFAYQDGTLRPLAQFAGVEHPSFLAVHPAGHSLYAVAESSEGSVHAFALQRDPWQLQPLGAQPSAGAHPCHLAITPNGRWLIVANYSSGTAALLPINADGSLGAPSDIVRHSGSGPRRDRQEAPHCHSTIITPDGAQAIVADLGTDELVIYRIDEHAGRLLRQESVATAAGAGPRHAAMSPDGTILYVANELDCSVTIYDYTAGSLQPRGSHGTLAPDAPASIVADIHLDTAGRRLYVSNRGDNSITIFDVLHGGDLRERSRHPCGGEWPRNFLLLPNDQHILVANQHSNAIALLSLDEHSGIGALVEECTVPGASCVIAL